MFYSQGFAISILMVTAFPTGSYAGTSEAESQRVRRHVQEGPRPVFEKDWLMKVKSYVDLPIRLYIIYPYIYIYLKINLP